MVPENSVRSFHVVHFDSGVSQERDERVAHEEPLEIQVNGASLAVVMRTPGHDEDLVRGFLVTEGIVTSPAEIESVRHCTTVPDADAEDNVMQVRLHVPFDLERHRRHTFASASCGVCGKATIENACRVAPPLASSARVSPAVLSSLPARLQAAQAAFALTGGLHAAALFRLDAEHAGELVVVREDVGRHNAVDKCVGAECVDADAARADAARADAGAGERGLFVSGRVSFEIVQKAVAARIPIVAGISAPSSLAVRMARALGVTLVGFLRGTTMNVYAGEQRVG